MNGVGSDRFEPNSTVTRAQVATVLYRLAGSPSIEITNPFADVADNTWYTVSINWTYAEGIMIGSDDGLAHPTELITSEHLELMIAKL